ncbi:MAG: hypothetical protein AB1510_12245, partial [Bacillota bacterium]
WSWKHGLQTGGDVVALLPVVGTLKYTDEGVTLLRSGERISTKAARGTGNAKFILPKTIRSAKGVEGKFSNGNYTYRIDTNKVAPGEGGFHIHIYRNGVEVAKVNGRGGYATSHGGRILQKPSELDKTVRNEINRLVTYVQKNLK